MAKNVLNRHFTTREKILMLVLVCVLFIGLYFLLVFYPIRNQLEDIDADLQEIDYNMIIQNAREEIYDNMVAELNSEEHKTVMPYFDNYNNLMEAFEYIFKDLEPTIDSSRTVTKKGNVYSRVFVISLKIENFYNDATEEPVDYPDEPNPDEEETEPKPNVTDYNKAKEVLLQLTRIEYNDKAEESSSSQSKAAEKTPQYCRCQINSLSISPEEGDLENDTLTVSCTITYYEIDR